MSTVNGFQVGSETLKYNYESLDNYNTPNFSTSSSTAYAVGDYVMYNGKLYKCTTATTGGTWVSSNWTEAVLSDDVSDLTRQLSDVESAFDEFSDLRYDADANLFNIATIIPNKYVNQSSGQLNDSSAYTASDFIDVSAYDYILLSRKTLSGFAVRWCTYSENKNYITGEIYDSNLIFSDIYFGESAAYYRIDTHDASYFRFSATNVFFDSTKNPAVVAGYYPREVRRYEDSRYVISETAQDQRSLASFTESAGGFYYNAWTNLGLYSGRSVELGLTQALKGNERITAFCKITTMGELSIGFAGNSYKFHIDDTNYWWTANGIDGGIHYAHNMTIRDYLAIMMELAEDGATCNIRVETNGGEWTRTNSTFTSGRGKVNITSNGFVGEINIVWMPKISKPIWVFGDSYISNYSNQRWGYYLIQWGLSSQVLMDGYPGAPAQDAIVDFENLITMGTPRYAVWCMGMNNADSGAINSDWKTATETFIADCEKYNITPILATIPNTPNNDNTYKNAWVKSSGYRYVDFAWAVNAESANATWYDGMLSNDNTHPDVQGAICLATAFIDFVPEVTFK